MSEIEPNNIDRTLVITDSWKPEWCREGVQVPVKSAEEQKKPEIKYQNYSLWYINNNFADSLILTMVTKKHLRCKHLIYDFVKIIPYLN